MNNPESLSYEQLKQRLESAESALKALREDGVDTNLREREGYVVRLAEAKRAEQALSEHQERLRLALESASEGVWEWDFTTGMVTFDRIALEMVGYQADFAPQLGEWWIEQIHPEDRPAVNDAFAAFVAGETDTYAAEFRLAKRDGEHAWVASTARIVRRDEQGKPLLVVGIHRDITQRKRDEIKLREAEEDLRALLDATPFPVAVVDSDDSIIHFWSSSAQEIFGHTAPTAQEWYEIAYPDPDYREQVIRRWKPALALAKETDQPVNAGEYRVTCADGSERICELHAAFVRGNLVITFGDITNRKRDERRILHLNRVLRGIRNVNQIITQEKDRDTLLRRVCDALVSARGYASAWLALQDERELFDSVVQAGIGDHFTAFCADLEQGMWPECARRALAEPNRIVTLPDPAANCPDCPLATDYRGTVSMAMALHHNDRTYGVLVVALPQELIDDEAERSLFGELAGDVAYALYTLETEQEHQRTQDALADFAVRFREAVRGGNIGLWDWDLATNEVQYSAEWKAQIGYAEDEIGDTFEEWRSRVHPDDLPAAQATVERAIAERQPSWNSEFRFKHRDGTWRWIAANASILTDDAGQPLRALGSHVDITERKHSEEDRERLFQLIENADSIAVFKDPELRYLNVNKAFLRLTGYESLQEIVGKTDADLLQGRATQQQIREYTDNDRRALGLPAGEYVAIEERLTGEDGRERTFMTKKFPIYSESGHLRGVSTLTTEITERVRAESALRDQYQTMESLLRASQSLSQSLDIGTVFEQLEQGARQLMPCDAVVVSLFDSDTETITCSYMSIEDQRVDVSELPSIPLEPEGQGMQSQVIRSAEPLIIDDVDAYAAKTETMYQVDNQGQVHDRDTAPSDGNRARSKLMVPMILGGEVTGVVYVSSYDVAAYSQVHQDLLQSLADRAASAYHNALLYESAQQEIKRRIELENEMRTREFELAEAQRVAKVGSWVYNVQEQVSRWSTQMYINFGLEPSRDPYPYEAHREIIHPDDWDRWDAAVQRAATEGIGYDLQLRIVRPGGDLVHLRTQCEVLRDEDGRVRRLVGTAQDITDMVEAREALARSESRFRALMEQSPIAIAIYNADGSLMQINQAFADVSGLSDEMCEGLLARFNILDDRWLVDQEYADQVRRAFAGEQVFRDEHNANPARILQALDLPSEGVARPWIQSQYYPITDQHGELLNVILIHQDLTATHLARRELERQRNLLDRTLEILPVGLWLTDAKGQIRRGNRAARKLWGLDQASDLPAPGTFAARRMPTGERIADGDWASDHAVNQGMTVVDEELEIETFDGQTRTILNYAAPVLDEQGEVEGAVVVNLDITDRKQAAQALRETAQALAQAQRVAHVGSWTWHIQEDRLEWSDEMYRIFGLDRDTFTGRLGDVIEQSIHPDDRAIVETSNRSVQERAQPIPVQYRIIRPDGQLRTVWAEAGELLRDPSGQPAVLTGIVQDITESEAAVAALRASEERYRTLFENMTQGVFYQDEDGKLTDINRAGLDMFGLDREAFLGRTSEHPDWDVVDESGYPLEAEQHPSIVALRKGQPVVNRLIGIINARSKERVWVNVSALPQFREGDPLPYQVFVTMQDETARTEATAALARRERELSNLTQRQQTLLSAIPDIVVEVDMGRVHRWMNEAGAAFYGPDAIGRPASDYFVGEQDTYQVVDPVFAGTDDTITLESWQRRCDGQERLLAWWCRSLKDGQGCVIGALSTARDVTDQHLAEQQLRQSQKIESVGRLAGGVAHDFNNMLQVIISHTELATEQLPEDAAIRADLDEISKAAQRSAGLTRQLLGFARKQTISPKDLVINDAIAQTLRMLQRLVGEEIKMVWKPGAAVGSVHMDPNQLDQILANLVVNARDAIGGIGSVIIETESVTIDDQYPASHIEATPGPYVALSITDTGSGMSKNVIEHLFEPFFTTKGLGEGTGLGLATVYGIVKQNGGFINVYSELGEGTTFRVYLPRIEKEETQDATGGPAPQAAGGSETILLVEDEPRILHIAQIALTARGYHLLVTSSPLEAIRIAQESTRPIDLLISDVVMPEMNGVQLCKRIAEIWPNTKTLLMSGYTANVVLQRGVAQEDIDLLQKPFSLNKLTSEVRRILDQTDKA